MPVLGLVPFTPQAAPRSRASSVSISISISFLGFIGPASLRAVAEAVDHEETYRIVMRDSFIQCPSGWVRMHDSAHSFSCRTLQFHNSLASSPATGQISL